MDDTVKAGDKSRIPAPLCEWLDHAILAQMSDRGPPSDASMARKASIVNAILYPLESKPRKTKRLPL